MLGADHHGYVGRMMAMCAAFGDEPGENLEILIGQMVNLLRDGEPVRMSKRAGTVVTIDDLVDAIGVDAGRYALARYPRDSTDRHRPRPAGRKATNDNPVFYVQYAHARAGEPAAQRRRPGCRSPDDFDPTLLAHEKEGELLRALAEFPRVVAAAAELREPHRVARYLEELAGTYHRFYDTCRVLPARRRGDRRPAPGAARRWSTRPARCSPTAWSCSASPHPSGCESCPPPTRPAGRTPTAPSVTTDRAARRGCASRATPTRSSRPCGRRRPARPTAS